MNNDPFYCRLVFLDFCSLCGLDKSKQDIILTLILFVINLALAVVVPNISAVIELLGGSAALIIFSLPGMWYFPDDEVHGSYIGSTWDEHGP